MTDLPLSETPLPADTVGLLAGMATTRAIRRYRDEPVPDEVLRAVLFAALCKGRSRIQGFSRGEDNVSTAHAMRAMGAIIEDVDKSTLKVIKGEDLIKRVMLATGGTWSQASGIAAAMNRLCSADLPSRKAFYRAANRFGSKARIFMNGEEGGVEGRTDLVPEGAGGLQFANGVEP